MTTARTKAVLAETMRNGHGSGKSMRLAHESGVLPCQTTLVHEPGSYGATTNNDSFFQRTREDA
jgi:hypothetical protein